jgi:hypothetical protein
MLELSHRAVFAAKHALSKRDTSLEGRTMATHRLSLSHVHHHPGEHPHAELNFWLFLSTVPLVFALTILFISLLSPRTGG